MTAIPGRAGLDTGTILRRGLLGLAAFGVLGTTIELVFLRHWSGGTQRLVWPAVLALALALAGLARRPSPTTIRTARILAILVLLVALGGVGFHVLENLGAGPLDRHYTATWGTLSMTEQWWLAVTGGVGPAPTLAPGSLAEIALAILLASARHPALERPDRQ